jgi:hypothetical protein
MSVARGISYLLTLSLVAIWACANVAEAKGNGYICKIVTVGFLQDDGTLEFRAKDPWVGMTFAVDRGSGSIIGDAASTNGWHAQVLDPGSEGQGFKMIATTSALIHVQYLDVAEYVPGAVKPFVLMDDTTVKTGTCE